MGGPGDPWSLQQQAWGSPFKCFQLWQGCGETLHCKSLKKTELWKERKKKNSQVVQNGFQKRGHKSVSKAQGQEVKGWGAGNPRSSGDVWLCNSQLRLWAEAGWWTVLGGQPFSMLNAAS